MGVFRVDKNKNYTHMPKYHLRDPRLSLRAKGLMSWMLSLPDDWDYSVAGLAKCCVEGREAVRKVVQELEETGYVERVQARGSGRFDGYDYILHEQSGTAPPSPGKLGDGEPPLPGKLGTGKLGTDSLGDGHNNVEDNNINKTNPPIVPQRGTRRSEIPDYRPDWFEAFWKAFPPMKGGRKPAKARARAAWNKLRPDRSTVDEMATALRRQKSSEQWQAGIGIPYASTWLNQRMWEEDFVEPAPVPDQGTPSGRRDIDWV